MEKLQSTSYSTNGDASFLYMSTLERRRSLLRTYFKYFEGWDYLIVSVVALATRFLQYCSKKIQEQLTANTELDVCSLFIPSNSSSTSTASPIERGPSHLIDQFEVFERDGIYRDACCDSADPEKESIPTQLQETITGRPGGASDICRRNPKEAAEEILDIIQQYGQHIRPEADLGSSDWLGRSKFLERVKIQVERNEAIQMILPAFPWKSINKIDKVNGTLPDLGEVLALARLNCLCEDIKKVYPCGGELTIATDGLVFDDILGIPEEDTWAYSKALMNIAAERSFRNLKLLRVMDILGLTDGQLMTRENYLSLTAKSRSMLLEGYSRTEEEISTMIKNDKDTLLTYCGFIRFLETDLRHSKIAENACSGTQYRKCVKSIAKGMMIRAESFTKLIEEKCPQYVRISIHPSSGAHKLSVPLIVQPNGEFPKTPWHCTIAVGVDGSYRAVHAKDVRETHKLIFMNGQPYYYRERSALWDWEHEDTIFEPQYPTGLLVRPGANNGTLQLLKPEQIARLIKLAKRYRGLVRVAGFVNSMDISTRLEC